MHTLRMIMAGLFLLALFLASTKLVVRPSWTFAHAARAFIPVWLVVAIGNMLVGMFSAGIPFLTELAVIVAVFGVPALAAWAVSKSVAS